MYQFFFSHRSQRQGWVLRKSFRPQLSLANGWGIWHPGLWAMDANLWDMQMWVKDFKQRDGRLQRDIWKWESSMQQRNSFQDFIFGIQLFTIVLIIILRACNFFLKTNYPKKTCISCISYIGPLRFPEWSFWTSSGCSACVLVSLLPLQFVHGFKTYMLGFNKPNVGPTKTRKQRNNKLPDGAKQQLMWRRASWMKKSLSSFLGTLYEHMIT